MAKTGASGLAALQRLTPDDRLYEVSRDMIADGEKRAKERQKKKDDLEAEKAQADKVFYDGLEFEDVKSTVTGFNQRDDVMGDFARQVNDRAGQLGLEARKAYEKGDFQEARRLSDLQKKQVSIYKNMATNEKQLEDIFTEYMKMYNDGKINPADKEHLSFMESMYKNNVKIVPNENGNVVLKAIVKDDNGKEYLKSINIDDLINKDYAPYPHVPVQGQIDALQKNFPELGKYVRISDDGYKIITTSGGFPVEKQMGNLDNQIDAIVADEKVMSSLLQQITGREKLGVPESERPDGGGEFTEQDYKDVKKGLKEMLLGRYQDSYEEKESGKADRDLKLKIARENNALKREIAKSKGKKKEQLVAELRRKQQDDFLIRGEAPDLRGAKLYDTDKKESGGTVIKENFIDSDGNMVVITEDRKRNVIPNNEIGFNEFMNRISDTVSQQEVAASQPLQQDLATAGSQIEALRGSMKEFFPNGEFTGEVDNDVIEAINSVYPNLAKEDWEVFDKYNIQINGERIDLNDDPQALEKIDRAARKAETDPLNLGL